MPGLLYERTRRDRVDRRGSGAPRGRQGGVAAPGGPGGARQEHARRVRRRASSCSVARGPWWPGRVTSPRGHRSRCCGDCSDPRSRRPAGSTRSKVPRSSRSPCSAPGADLSQGVDYGCQWLIAWLAERAPLVLAIDDAHWADGASLRVLLDVQAEISFQRVGDADCEPTGREPRDPASARGDGRVTGLRSVDARHAVACRRRRRRRDRLGEPADDAFVDACLKVSRGNAFYCASSCVRSRSTSKPDVRAFVENGTLSLRRTVSWRLGELGPDATGLAQAAAVLGDGCSLHQAAELAHLDEAVAVRRLHASRSPASWRTATRSSSCTRCCGPRSRWSCPTWFSGSSTRGRLGSSGHRRRIRRSVAQHLLASPGSGDVAVSAYLASRGAPHSRQGRRPSATRLLRRALDEPAPADQRDRSCCGSGAPSTWRWTSTLPESTSRTAFGSRDREVAL